MNRKELIISISVLGIALFATGYYKALSIFIWNFVSTVFKLSFYVVAAVIGISLALLSHPHEAQLKLKLAPCIMLLKKTKEKLQAYKPFPKKKVKHSTLISRNVDDVIDELIGLLLKDYVESWYGRIVQQRSSFCEDLKPHIRQMLFTFHKRCSKIDDVKLFTCDIVNIVNEHLQRIKASVLSPTEKSVPYQVYPFLSNKDAEQEYLRHICQFLLVTLLPENYAKSRSLTYLLREIFACSVFYPLVDKMCDPDLINLRLIAFLKNQQVEAEKRNRTYAYAETYEDFVKLIQECRRVDDLHRLRYITMTEIMHATTISKFKRSKGMDADKEFNPQKTNKGDLLQSRNLSRYLNQLRFAKNLCEKRLKLLGGPDYISSSKGPEVYPEDKVPGKKVLSMSVIMQSNFCRGHFSKFLQKEEKHCLLGFWEAVEEMKQSDKSLWHQLGNNIVQMYIHNQASGVKLNKNTLKGIEEFIMANKGPQAFFQAQDEIYKVLEENYYASFIVSDVYHKMLTEAEKQGIDFAQNFEDDDDDNLEMAISQNPEDKMESESEVSVFDHSSYARTQLKILREKLNDKIQAVQAFRSNTKCDKKNEQVIAILDKEIEDLCVEQNMLENHIEKTELWIKYLGLWQATVIQAEVIKENDKLVPLFNIMVHLASDAGYHSSGAVGWVVTRNLSTFHNLHQKLVPAAAWLKKIELPTKPRFKSLDKNYLGKMKSCLQTFLSAVTKDDGLNKSEALYSFLSPSPEHMKLPLCPPKKPFRFNILQFLKNVQNSFSLTDEAEEEELLFLDDTDSKEDKKDSIAEPLYGLIGEIFELKGVFNWLRRSLVIFVQVAYGQTINRQLRETVSWILSEPMLLFYLQLFRDTMWPVDKPSAPPKARTGKEKLETKNSARVMLLNNIPEVLNNLFGQQNAKKGVTKIFDALQNKTLNKQLLYNILEALIYEYAPELKTASPYQSKQIK